MRSIGRRAQLLLTALRFFLFTLCEERKVRSLFYHHPLVKTIDLAFKKAYQGKNPYTLSRRFLLGKNSKDPDIYGETPLTTLYQLLTACGITKDDHFVDLGAGRGRGVLFASAFFGCKATGIEWIPVFSLQAERLATLLPHHPPRFYTQSLLSFPLHNETILYFYSLCLEEKTLLAMIQKFLLMPSNPKIVTISFPLSDYSPSFTTLTSLPVIFSWGKTQAYINVKN